MNMPSGHFLGQVGRQAVAVVNHISTRRQERPNPGFPLDVGANRLPFLVEDGNIPSQLLRRQGDFAGPGGHLARKVSHGGGEE